MAKRWTFKECKTLKEVVEAKAGALYTKRGDPRKTFPQSFWEDVSVSMEMLGHRDRSASSVRKKFNSLGYTIQGSLNYQDPNVEKVHVVSPAPGAVRSVLSAWGSLELLTDFSKNIQMSEGDTVTLKFIGTLNGTAIVRRMVK